MNASHDWSPPPTGRRPGPRIRRGRCVAMVDARFIEWVCEREDEPAPHRDRWAGFAEHLLHHAVGPTELVRTYWYASHGPAEAIEGLVHRPVAAEAADSGVDLVLSMARDLATLARNGACDQVLLATDDDRLLTAIDAAQLQGLRVHLVAEPAADDLETLARNDAALAALLRQCDGRIIVSRAEVEDVLWGDGGNGAAWTEPQRPGERSERGPGRRAESGPQGRTMRPRGEPADPQEREALRTQLSPLVTEWWGDLPYEDRLELQAQLPELRGLPQETDRQLLLRISQSLGRALRPPEKLLMRELARGVALGSGGDAPTDRTPDAPEPALEGER